MGTIIGQVAGIIVVTLQLAMVVYLTITLYKSSWPERGQEMSDFTGLPTWFTVPCNYLQTMSKKTSLEFASVFVTGVASLVCLRKGKKRYKTIGATFKAITNAIVPTQENQENTTHNGATNSGHTIPWSIFDAIITVYVIITFIAMVAGSVFGVGKLWAIIGIFHNIMEVFIVGALWHRTKANYIILIALVYSVVVTGAISQLPWYWDAMFFKFQGLILDFILPVLFFIVAYENLDQSGENQSLLEGHLPTLPTHPTSRLKGLGYLFFAALVHLIGNVFDVVGNDSGLSAIVFPLSYFVSFPVYAIYVHKDKQKKPVQTNITGFNFILLFLWCATASAI
ncbi:hypothetical protein C1645_875703, partial [Glomus cerebriforme]